MNLLAATLHRLEAQILLSDDILKRNKTFSKEVFLKTIDRNAYLIIL